MKATDLLMKQHREVEVLFTKLSKSQETRQKKSIAAELRLTLEVHMAIEEDIFYPAYREAVESEAGDALALEAHEEHHVVKLLLSELPHLDTAHESFRAKMTVLQQLIERHVQDEEQRMFPEALKLLGKTRLEELGDELLERESQLAA